MYFIFILVKVKLIITTFLLIFFGVNSIAQYKELIFKNFTQEEGLPSNETYFVYRDIKNYIWIATDQGVVRFNGNKMEHFNLPDNVVFKIREDNKGRIWFFSLTGQLAYFFKESIHPFKYNDSIRKNIKDILITDAYVTDDDEVIINSALGFNYKIHESGQIDKIGYIRRQFTDSNIINITQPGAGAFFARFKSYAERNSDSLYINLKSANTNIMYTIPVLMEYYQHYGCAYNSGLYFFAGKILFKLNRDGSIKTKQFSSDILCIHTSGNNLWVGLVKQGAFLLNLQLEEIDKEAVLKDKSITSITNDYENGLWFSSLENGVYYLKNIRVSILKGDSSLARPVFRMHNMGDSALLFGNSQGAYIFSFSSNDVSLLYDQKNERVNDLFIDDKKNLFFASKNKSFYNSPLLTIIKNKKAPEINRLIKISSASEILKLPGQKYIFSQSLSLVQFYMNPVLNIKISNNFSPDKLGTSSFKPSMLYQDLHNQVWVASTSRLYKLNNTFDSLIAFKESDAFIKKGVTCMKQMENKIYCIGIRFGGIVLMKDTSIIANISEKNGLLNNSIKYLFPVNNQLWVATARGVSVIQFHSYNPVVYTVTNIGESEGFYNLIIYQLMDYKNNIMAATSNGIYMIEKPDKTFSRESSIIPLYIRSIKTYKGDTSNVSKISVPHNKNRLLIKYSAICFNSPKELEYYYRLRNTDTNWQKIAGTELLLENLSPGTYNLELKTGILNQQRFSEIRELKIVVEKPWWQNNWFRLAMILLFAAVANTFYRSRIKVIKTREKQKNIQQSKIKELEQTALRSQMNPHFIFNCLTSIQQQIISGNTTDANEHLVKFARLIRKTLEISSRPYISIFEEKEYLAEYLYLEQLRLPGHFEFTIDIAGDIDVSKTEIPNMMLQPIVENCIRHGIKELVGKKGMINISLLKQGDFIICSITDNGAGRKNIRNNQVNSIEKQKSYGLDIVRKRLELLTEKINADYCIEIKDLINTDGSAAGTQVVIQLPFKLSNS